MTVSGCMSGYTFCPVVINDRIDSFSSQTRQHLSHPSFIFRPACSAVIAEVGALFHKNAGAALTLMYFLLLYAV